MGNLKQLQRIIIKFFKQNYKFQEEITLEIKVLEIQELAL
jgi:hypothetical protein